MRALLTFSLLVALVFLISCSGGPAGPDPGTPAFYWNAAKETFAAGNFLTANDNLDLAMKSADLKAKGLPWALVLEAGLCQGYQELADAYETGVKAAKTNATAFLRQRSDLRRYARGFALQFVDHLAEFQKSNKDQAIKLPFAFPQGTPALPAQLAEVADGTMPNATQMEDLQKAVIARAVLLQTASMVGAEEDATKAREMFKAGSDVSVPRAQFLLAAAKATYNQALLFGPKKLYELDKAKLFCERALEIVRQLHDNREAKELSDQIEKTLKELTPRST